VIKAQFPVKTFITIPAISARDRGRGVHTEDFSHYEEMPRDAAEKVMRGEETEAAAESH